MRAARLAVQPKLTLGAVGKAVAIATGRPAGPYTASAVGQWEKDESEPPREAVIAFAKLTRADASWLFTGIHSEQLGQSGQLPAGGRLVPKLNISRIDATNPVESATGDVIHSHFPCSARSFWLPVFDGRNAPEYVQGDHIVIDPAEAPIPGDMVLARVDSAPMFGAYAEREGGVIAIVALNPKWSPAELKSIRGDHILGVMTEHAKPRRN